MSEVLLTEDKWRAEVNSVINDIKDHVHSVTVSHELNSSESRIYLNITTLEERRCCVELSALGFLLVGSDHNLVDVMQSQHFETPYSLLGSISPMFYQSFGAQLMEKLTALSSSQNT